MIMDDCNQFDINNVEVLDCDYSGIRLFGSPIVSPIRRKIGSIRNSKFAGNNGEAIVVVNSRSVLIENCRFGYSVSYDGREEIRQTNAIHGTSKADGIRAINNRVEAVSSGVAYLLDEAGGEGAIISNPSGISTRDGAWASEILSGMQTAGDEDLTLVVGQDLPVVRFNMPLTANRQVTLDIGNAYPGARFRIVRDESSAYELDVDGLKTIPSSTPAFVEVEYDGNAWRLIAYGAL